MNKPVEEMTKEELIVVANKGKKSKRLSEAELKAKYPHLVEGSLTFDAVANKQKAQIICTVCSTTVEVYTSDLFQIDKCAGCRAAARKEAAKARREAERAALKELAAREKVTEAAA